MEFFGAVLGLIVWGGMIAVWVGLCCLTRRSKNTMAFGIGLVSGLPMIAAFLLAHYMFIDEPLYSAATEGNLTQVKVLLALGADPDVEVEGLPALEQASERGCTEVVRILIAHGADLETRNLSTGHTALQSAQVNKHITIIRLLRQAGAKR